MGYRSTNTIIVTSAPVDVGPQAPGSGNAALALSARGTPTKIVAQGGRVGLGLSGHLATVRKSAQTGVAPLSLLGLATVVADEVSGAFTHVTLVRDYTLATGEAPVGIVYFTPSEWMVNNGVTVPAAPVASPLSSEGLIQLDLAANDDVGTTPTDSYYEVREEITGQPTRIYSVVIHYDVSSPTDLATLPVIP